MIRPQGGNAGAEVGELSQKKQRGWIFGYKCSSDPIYNEYLLILFLHLYGYITIFLVLFTYITFVFRECSG